MRSLNQFKTNTSLKFVNESAFTWILDLGSWILVLVSVFFLTAGVLYAKPERLEIKSTEERVREEKAKALAGKIDFSKIEDPDARLALRTVFDALDLNHKKSDENDSRQMASDESDETEKGNL